MINGNVSCLKAQVPFGKFNRVRKTERRYKKIFFKHIIVWRLHDSLPFWESLWLIIAKTQDQMK
jgi:hypothetical protein